MKNQLITNKMNHTHISTNIIHSNFTFILRIHSIDIIAANIIFIQTIDNRNISLTRFHRSRHSQNTKSAKHGMFGHDKSESRSGKLRTLPGMFFSSGCFEGKKMVNGAISYFSFRKHDSCGPNYPIISFTQFHYFGNSP